MSSEGNLRIGFVGLLVVLAGGGVAYAHYWAYFREKKAAAEEVEKEGQDVENIKDGKAAQ